MVSCYSTFCLNGVFPFMITAWNQISWLLNYQVNPCPAGPRFSFEENSVEDPLIKIYTVFHVAWEYEVIDEIM